MRYQGNALKVWHAPTAHVDAGLDKPLAENPMPKDKWVSHDVIALTYPPMEDPFVSNSARILFGEQARLQERYPDPEVQGGKCP
jgi:hypothetical protein